jgi:hypothetical protein
VVHAAAGDLVFYGTERAREGFWSMFDRMMSGKEHEFRGLVAVSE